MKNRRTETQQKAKKRNGSWNGICPVRQKENKIRRENAFKTVLFYLDHCERLVAAENK